MEEGHLAVAETLKNEVVSLMGHWDRCHNKAKTSLVKAEQTALKLQQIEKELLEFRKSLRLKQTNLGQKTNPRRVAPKTSDYSSCHDSGISDGSSLSDFGIPDALEHLSRLRDMTRNLETSLSPHDPTMMTITRVIHDTSLEIDDLQQLYMKQRQGARKPVKRGHAKKTAMNRDRLRPYRLSRFSKITLGLQALLLSVLLLSWLCQPQCCDNISAISNFSFKYVNGPPPI